MLSTSMHGIFVNIGDKFSSLVAETAEGNLGGGGGEGQMVIFCTHELLATPTLGWYQYTSYT